MSIDELKKLCDKLDAERKTLSAHRSRLAMCDLSGHQRGITLNIRDLGSIELSEMDRGYAERLIRGREMIMLGVKKALRAMVDAQAEKVATLERAIADARVSP
jgi:hypothetical protein